MTEHSLADIIIDRPYGVRGRERYHMYAEMNPTTDMIPLTIAVRLKQRAKCLK